MSPLKPEAANLLNTSPQEILNKFSALQNQGSDLYRKTTELTAGIERFMELQKRQAPIQVRNDHRQERRLSMAVHP